jgi:hypothetical protein
MSRIRREGRRGIKEGGIEAEKRRQVVVTVAAAVEEEEKLCEARERNAARATNQTIVESQIECSDGFLDRIAEFS